MGLKNRRGTKKVFLVEKMSRFSKRGRQKVSLVPNVGSPIKHFNCSSDNDAFLEQKKRLDTRAQVEPFLPRLLFALNAVVHASFMNGPPYAVCCHYFKYKIELLAHA